MPAHRFTSPRMIREPVTMERQKHRRKWPGDFRNTLLSLLAILVSFLFSSQVIILTTGTWQAWKPIALEIFMLSFPESGFPVLSANPYELSRLYLVDSYRGAPKTLVWIDCIAYYFFGSACMPISCKMGGSPKKNMHPKWPQRIDQPRQTVDESRMPPNFAIFNMVPPMQTNVGVISQQFLWLLGHPELTTKSHPTFGLNSFFGDSGIPKKSNTKFVLKHMGFQTFMGFLPIFSSKSLLLKSTFWNKLEESFETNALCGT